MKFLLLVCLTFASSFALAHGMSAEDQARILNAGYLEYLRLGATHMLSGYDHLLFLFGVMFFLTRFKDILILITAFTVGHSITLVFATLAGITANYYLIDAVIALTVCYKAFDNLDGFKKYLQTRSPSLIWMVFIFGLIHGFGLSTRLQQLPLGNEGLVLKILSFNLGVELGQIAALSIMFVLLTLWRKTESFQKFSAAANVLLMFLGGLLLLMQLHGYQHSQYPDDFPLNADDHSHIHEDMAKSESPLSGYKKPLTLGAEPDAAEAQESDMHTHDGEDYHSH
ncbi:HupE/UreJ family protein [Cellvibrio sp. QJXJ]|uniref:HupE/UreJ family protein n=1 Tax=Cellvibrio sp. QJXJ TaxID=2964606 RepID=UPI0021C25DCA|nr:HupE/UreJ family protein [Cellvibrio sp. QJXJ]UUA71659.1 HupE/UreJ family protein [Cellvibrio sp. QJXJ]